MSITVCIAPAKTLDYPKGGGHLWEYLNWALGLRALGCQVIWLETVTLPTSADALRANIAALKLRLERYGLVNCLALHSLSDQDLPLNATTMGCLDLDAAAEADLLLELRYDTPSHVVSRFRRSALLDIDPGLLQLWMSKGQIRTAPHDVYFTTGETVGQPGTRIPDLGLKWIYTPSCVALECWPTREGILKAPFTTVAHWYASAWLPDQEERADEKRTGFLPFLDMPRLTAHPFELALDLWPEDEQRSILERRGWRVVDAHTVAATPWDYQRYIQDSFAEFSCAKPACLRLENAWVSNRTLCYLASGKPAVVQNTGPSQFLPDSAGLFRFRDLKEAAQHIERVMIDYEKQCKLARNLAEAHFDARQVVATILERALS
jgi:hypothetical protein